MERDGLKIPPDICNYLTAAALLITAAGVATVYSEQVHTAGKRIFPNIGCRQDNQDNEEGIGIYQIDALPDYSPLIRTSPNINAAEIGYIRPDIPVLAREVWGGTYPTDNKSFIKTEKNGKRCGLWFEIHPINGAIQVYWVDDKGNYIPQINVNGEAVTVESGIISANFMKTVVEDISKSSQKPTAEIAAK